MWFLKNIRGAGYRDLGRSENKMRVVTFADILQACFAQPEQRALVASRARNAGAARAQFSFVRFVAERGTMKSIVTAAEVARRDRRDLFMSVGHEGVEDHLEWGRAVVSQPPSLVLLPDEPISVSVNQAGWATCPDPDCGYSFKPSDPNAWDGERHLRCKQRIIIEIPGDVQGN